MEGVGWYFVIQGNKLCYLFILIFSFYSLFYVAEKKQKPRLEVVVTDLDNGQTITKVNFLHFEKKRVE